MALRLPDRWLWDFWFADTGDAYHVFYLQAPRHLGAPGLRHVNASVGHARSDDLMTWEVLPDALHPGSPGEWDDVATWTGSVIEGDGRWYLFYTGSSTREGGLVQRVGAAVSDDLVTWQKLPDNPLFEADPRWYETLPLDHWHDVAWRDPWVFADPAGDGFHALVTARSRDGEPSERGVIGHARSDDLISWRVGPPLTRPSGFGHLEVPQLVSTPDGLVLLFSCGSPHLGASRADRDGVYGTFAARADGPLGPFDIAGAEPVAERHLYSGRVIADREGRLVFLAFVDLRDGGFVGELSDPVPFAVPWSALPT